MKKIILPFLLIFFSIQGFTQLNMELLDQMSYPVNLNDVWGWADPNSDEEYAIVGLNNGVSIVDVTDPTNIVEVQFISGPNSTWRDIKSWGNFVYVTNETGGGLLVADMSGAPNNITWEYKIFDIPGWGNLTDCHNLYIDENGYCYLAGCNLNAGRMLIILDVFTNPANPAVVYSETAAYAHDYFAQNNILYSSEIYEGVLKIYDVSNKQNISLLSSQPTPYSFTHNAWVNAENTVVFTTDEKANAPVAAYDITDLNDIVELDQFRPVATLGANVIPHNVHVWDNWLIISYYTDGGIIADASRPENIIEVGNWDSFLGGNGGYHGVWGSYPFLPSGLVLLSDINNGLFVCGPTYVRACWLEGKVTNAQTGTNIFGAEVNINSSQANFATSDLVGKYKTGQAIPGYFDVTFSAMGYISKTVPATLENGVLTILDVALEPIVPVASYSGQVVSSIDGSPVPAAQVILQSGTFRFTTTSNVNGLFTFNNIYRDEYTIAAAKWGRKHASISGFLIDQSTDPVTLEMHLGYQDDFFVSQGWTTNVTASSGWWQRGEPLGTTFNGGLANPDRDVPGDIGKECFVTGNNGGDPGNDDVDDGYVALISPVMNLTIYYEPVLSYYTWFVNNGGTGTPPNDTFQIRISNGSEEVVLETITTSNPAWNDRTEFKISDHIAITNNMQVIFEASDDVGDGHIVEAAIDAFLIEESAFPMFTFSDPNGCPGLEVEFDETSGYAYSWDWFFENGSQLTSGDPDPIITYSTPGSNDVSLEVTTYTGAVFTIDSIDFVNVKAPPIANFNIAIDTLSVLFNNISTGGSSYAWEFGDGNTSSETTPTHGYTSPGTYQVSLTAEGDCGPTILTQEIIIPAYQPTAVFTQNHTAGCAPFVVQYTDQSLGFPDGWEWSFPGGDPALSTEQNPVVTYSSMGSFDVNLRVINAAGNSNFAQSNLVEINDVPAGSFTWTNAGADVSFTNATTNADSYFWTFNDGSGTTSDLQNPEHTFPGVGMYEVVLTAGNDCGATSFTQSINIGAVPPIAHFMPEQGIGCAPFTVQFFDQSENVPTSWQWSFPGGVPATSTEQNPVVTFPFASYYNVELIVSNSAGNGATLVADAVTVNEAPFANFGFMATGPAVVFNNTSFDADSYEWQFNDGLGSTSYLADPTHVFPGLGDYDVVLFATNDCGTTSDTSIVSITSIQPSADFMVDEMQGCSPFTVNFQDLSLGGEISSWEWSFPGGDPSTSASQNPTVSYTQAGVYSVTLKVTNPVGDNEITIADFVVVDDVPMPDFNFTIAGPVVDFSNTSTNADSHIWHFGDAAASTSGLSDPTFIYLNIGTYEVVLETTNDCGTSSISQEITITSIFPNAGFAVVNQLGCAPLEVEFMDISTGSEITVWEWVFDGGDPATSSDQNPIINYSLPGVYDVSLKVTNPVGESEVMEMGLVVVNDVPEADFNFSVNGPAVNFNNISVNADSYEWDFGDGSGNMVSDENPFYIFPDSGEYVVNLTATNECGATTITQTITISSPTNNVDLTIPVIEFYAAPNPFSDHTKVVYKMGQAFKSGKVILTNILGEMMAEKEILTQQGSLSFGAEMDQVGVYFLQLEVDGKRSSILKVLKLK